MKNVLLAISLFSFAACKEEPTKPPEQTSTQFNSEFQTSFVKSCVDKAPGRQKACECGAARLLKEFPPEKLASPSDEVRQKLETVIMPACLAES